MASRTEQPLVSRSGNADVIISSNGATSRPSPHDARPALKPTDSNTGHLTALRGTPDTWSPDNSAEEEEDYDDMKPEPEVLVNGAKRASVRTSLSRAQSRSDNVNGTTASVNGGVTATENGRPDIQRRKSIQVILEQTDKKGRYKLTADDPEIRRILQQSIEREAQEANSGKKHLRFRDMVFTRQFTTFDRQNPLSAESPFHGFFTLFWLGMALLLMRVAAQNWRTHGSVFGGAELLHMMFDRDVVMLGLTDGAMWLSMTVGWALQVLIAKGHLTWGGSGWIIQNIWQAAYLGGWIGFTFYREWPWTHTIFITLHSLVFLMKQHSYAFYNGYLSEVRRRKQLLEQKLKQVEDIQPTPTSPVARQGSYISTTTATDSPSQRHITRRRSSHGPKASTNFLKEASQITPIAEAVEFGQPLDHSQLQTFISLLQSEISLVSKELAGRSTDPSRHYPNNLTLSNFFDWTVLPTLVYELEYPRQETINWWYVLEKSTATFGTIWVMMVISQAYIYPAVSLTVAMKDAGLTLQQRWTEFPWILSDMLFPLLLEQLLTWYVIWECILNVLAELTRFADRGFYGAWWNSVSWDQYARDWNRPVHNFLLRHVYHSSISAFKLSKLQATFVTFFLSACVHELVMFCLFKKVRGYLFVMQLLQVPLAAMSRTSLLRGRETLGNLIFWVGLFIGPSLITCLYLIV